MPKKLTTEEFIKRSKKIYGDKYKYTKTVYTTAKESVVITCPIHGDFSVIPDNHTGKKRVGCRECKNNELKEKLSFSFKKFIKLAKEKFGEKFEYYEEEYISYQSPTKIKCPKHGFFKQTPIKHIDSKFGCKYCGSENVWKVRQKIDTKTFIERARKKHGNYYDYSLVDCNGTDSVVTIKCPIHGFFNQNAKDHYDGKGCRYCNTSKGEKRIREYLINKKGYSINNIIQWTQKKYNDLKDKYLLSYDFYLEQDNLLIEYNGIQHYKYKKRFYKTPHDFHIQLHHDWLKRKYAKKHGIKLLVISYKEFDNIETILENNVKKYIGETND